MIRKIIFFLFFLSTVALSAQTIGEWTVFPSAGTLTGVEDTGNEVFAVTGGSLFSYSKREDAIIQYSKKEGMSDADINLIGYDRLNKTLVIIYKNQNIDLLNNGTFYNIPDFMDKLMTGDKSVNNLYIQNGKAYLATAFGVVVVDIKRREISDTYNLGINTSCAFQAHGHIGVGLASGIMACPQDKNPYDITNWKHLSDVATLDAEVVGDKLYTIDSGGNLFLVQPDWSQTLKREGGYKRIKAYDESLCLLNENRIDIYNIQNETNSSIYTLTGMTDISALSEGEIWSTLHSGLYGIRRQGDTWDIIQENMLPNSSLIKDPYNMCFQHGRLYMTTGGPFRTFDNISGIISVLDQGNWTNFVESEVREQLQVSFDRLLDIAVSPFDPETFYAGSFTGGVYEFQGGKCVRRYIDDNDELTSVFGKGEHIWASALNMDKAGNLWILNSKVSHQLRMKTIDGKWYKYNLSKLGEVEDLYPLMITKHTRNPQKWFLSYYNVSSLNVFDENGTYDNTADDKTITFNSLTDQDGNIYKELGFRSLVEDNEGKVWVGTGVGPMIISDTENIFTSSGRCTRIKIPRNDGTGLADYLLDNVTITCMAVDAANRKWLGTSGNGIYLLSADGLETIHHFTAENSPLPSNEVLSIALDDASGQLYIGCMGGLVAYQSDAVEGKEDFTNVYAYPNPVRPEYNGVITVTGLMNNTLVKITDINNNLIYQSKSLGGQFTWNGLNHKGDKVKSGIYLVYGSAEDGKKGVVTKIMFIR